MDKNRVRMEEGWREALKDEFAQPYFDELTAKVRHDYASGRVYPPAGKIFAAFDASPFDKTKVVIIGQDPYHGFGQANGLAFSVNPGVPLPPSLRNILTEVSADTGAPAPASGDLTRWAEQGVLLLNTALSVKEGQPKSHGGIGWERLTDAAVRALSEKRDGLVFILWGADAARKRAMIDESKHLVLTSVHPSPLSASRGFFGNHHFTRANEYLSEHGKAPIKW
ncbi:MAG: uracil-DNA glycosylase [Muribaculaceae bacterium]|nr:uracil-DNA glycosylase [Muribaculaceae bacterium]